MVIEKGKGDVCTVCALERSLLLQAVGEGVVYMVAPRKYKHTGIHKLTRFRRGWHLRDELLAGHWDCVIGCEVR